MPAVIVLVLLIIALAVVDGFKNGVLRRLLETVGLILIFVFASRLADFVEPPMTKGMGVDPKVAFFVSWGIVIVGGVILVRILAAAISSLLQFSIVGATDRIGGAVVGLLFGSLLSSVLLIGFLALPFDDHVKRDVRDNPFTGPLLRLAPSVYDALTPLWDGRDFFPMIEERLEPLAQQAQDSIRAFMGEADREGSGEN